MLTRRQFLGASPAFATAAWTSWDALAQTAYPNRLIRIVIGNAAGGTDDAISRFVGAKLMAEFGQPVIVENRGGGSTTIAGSVVAASPPDGYTLLCLINTGIVQTVLRDKLPYKMNSFVPVIGVGGFPLGLAVSATTQSNASNMQELIAIARNGDGITYASGGVGTMAHLNTVRLLKAIQGKGVHVTYKNNPEGLQALMGGFTQMMLASASEVAAMRGDKLRVLAVTSEQRLPSLSDVPTMRELGYPQINPTLWHGYVAPVSTPPEVVAKLADAITRAVRDPEFQAKFKPLAFQEDIKTGDALSSWINGEAARWKEVITENRIQVE